jgi:hypothetical protein
MKKNAIFLFLLFTFQAAFTQNSNSIWVFGDSAGIDFSNVTNPVPISSGMDGRGSCSSIADSNGNLILYTAVLGYLNTGWNTRIFNAQHQILQNCDSITGEAWYNENITIPRPTHYNQFYTFSVGLYPPYNQGCFYSISDMNMNLGQGSVIKQNIKINNATSGDCLTAVKHGNGQDWWVINKYSKTSSPNHFNRFFIYHVKGDSVYAPITQNFNDATDSDFQRIIWHPSYNKFMLINPAGYMAEFNFDRCTGIITFDRNIFPEQTSNYNRYFWEGAYSPSGNLFYVSTTGVYITDTLYLFQYNLNATNIPLSCDTLERFIHPIGPGALRLAPDDKIYFSRAYESGLFGYPYQDSVRNYINENLSVINYPDSIGAPCGYSPFSFYLGGKRTYYGLPNNPYYDLGALAASPCDTITSMKKVSPNSYTTKFFPNPTTSFVTVYCSNKFSENSKLEIYNSIGVLMHSIVLPIYENYYTFSLENLISGIYNCKISSPQETRQIEKLVIIR